MLDGDNVVLSWSYDGPATFKVYSCTEPFGEYSYLVSSTMNSVILEGAVSEQQQLFYLVRVEND